MTRRTAFFDKKERGVGALRPVRTVIEVDDLTGELRNQSTVYVSPPKNEPPYVKVYLDSVSSLTEMPMYCWPVLWWMIRMLPYANVDQEFEFGAPMRRKAAGELGVSVSRIDHAVSDFLKYGVLLRVDRGLYRFNPVFFARGEWKDIQKLRSCGG